MSRDAYAPSVSCRAFGVASTYSLCNIIDYHCAVGIPVVHGRKRLVALLAGCVPERELDVGVVDEDVVDVILEDGGFAEGRRGLAAGFGGGRSGLSRAY